MNSALAVCGKKATIPTATTASPATRTTTLRILRQTTPIDATLCAAFKG